MATSNFWAQYAGSNLNLVFEPVTVTQPAVSVDVVVTYVQCPGGGGGISV
jgi:hypothetical protein